MKLYLIPYSLKSIGPSQEDAIRIAKQLGFDGIEGGLLTEEYLELLDRYGMECVNFMLKVEEDGTISDKTLRLFESHAVNRIVGLTRGDGRWFLPDDGKGFRGIPGAFGTFSAAVAAAEKANQDAAIAARYGLCTMYHNHTHEFRTANGEYLMDTYLRHTAENHVMEFDVGWALTAGVDPIYWMQRWRGRIGALHIKSCNWALNPEALGMICPEPPLEIGISKDRQAIQQAYAEGVQGPMDRSICNWTEVIRTAQAVGCDTFIVERERIYDGDILSCLQADHDHIRACIASL